MTEISKEYSEALFSLACEYGSVDETLSALETVAETFDAQPEYLALLSSPSVPLGARTEAIEQAFGGILPEHAVSFLQLLCEKRRIGAFYECLKEYRALVNARGAVVTATITSAVALTEEELSALKQKLEKLSGKTVITECHTDPSIMGGVIVEMDGTVIDGSVRHRLRELKEVMNQ